MKRALVNSASLEAIDQYSSKTLKLAAFFAKSGAVVTPRKMMTIGKFSHPVSVLAAFKNDLDKAVKDLRDIHALVSTVDENHFVLSLKSNEQDMRVVFGDSYDPKTYSLDFGGVELPLLREFPAELVKEQILQTHLGTDTATFENIRSHAKKIFSTSRTEAVDLASSMEYLGNAESMKEASLLVERIRDDLVLGYGEYVAQHSDYERRYLADFTQRAMVESVKKDSTYITAPDGIVQLAPRHKKQKELVDKIAHFIANNPTVRALEVDRACGLEMVDNVLQQIERDKWRGAPDHERDMTLAFRLLGNYNALGLHVEQYNLVACDFKKAKDLKEGGIALGHEMIHQSDTLYDEAREGMVKALRARLDMDYLKEVYGDKAAYYYNDREVIARGGEIAYLLNKYDYNGEDFSEFFARVRAAEDSIDNPHYINIVKGIEVYASRADIYFNFQDMEPENLLQMKEYYQSFFGVDGIDLKPAHEVEVNFVEPRKNIVSEDEEKRARLIRKYEPVGGVCTWTPSTVEGALKENDENPLLTNAEIVQQLIDYPTHIGRSKNSYNMEDVARQIVVLNMVKDHVLKKPSPELAAVTAKRAFAKGLEFIGSPKVNYRELKFLNSLARGEKMQINEVEFEAAADAELERLAQVRDEVMERTDDSIPFGERENDPVWSEFMAAAKAYSKAESKLTYGFRAHLEQSTDAFGSFHPSSQIEWPHSHTKVPNRNDYRVAPLNAACIKGLSKPIAELAKELLEVVDPNEFAAQFSIDESHILIGLLSSEVIREQIVGEKPELDKAMLGRLNDLGVIESALDNKDSYIVTGGFEKRPLHGYKHALPVDPVVTYNSLSFVPNTVDMEFVESLVAQAEQIMTTEQVIKSQEDLVQKMGHEVNQINLFEDDFSNKLNKANEVPSPKRKPRRDFTGVLRPNQQQSLI